MRSLVMRGLWIMPCLLCLTAPSAQAARVVFEARELFRIPFGTEREALGTAVEEGQFQFPRDFSMDLSGRFYIYDKKKHRIARYSAGGKFEIGFTYPATARQIFAHADSLENLWLLISDPGRGLYFGVYDSRGKRLREGVFSRYNQFRLHLDHEHVLQVIASSDKNPGAAAIFLFHEPSLLLKKLNMPPPPQNHHQLRRGERTFYIDPVPGTGSGSSLPVQRITDDARRPVADIKGHVIYITGAGEIYTRTGPCRIEVYQPDGSLKGRVQLTGLPSSCAAVRFHPDGHIYQLDGIPGSDQQYTPHMQGMRVIRWERR